MPVLVSADFLTFEASDFVVTPVFSEVRTFEFSIELVFPVTPGSVYVDPPIHQVDYRVSGSLTNTPSGFPAFNLVRSITGQDFYGQGSSLRFEVHAAADLSDGLQVSELVGSGVVFILDAREVDTGRYHPPIVRFLANGTGGIANSNNTGGINPVTQMEVDVDFGEEYITTLTFDPESLTLLPANTDLIIKDGFESP
jgi:hypothetical protein